MNVGLQTQKGRLTDNQPPFFTIAQMRAAVSSGFRATLGVAKLFFIRRNKCILATDYCPNFC